MKFNIKFYKEKKTKRYIKDNYFLLIVNGINKNAIDWIKTEQELQEMNINYYKVLNKITLKILKTSIYRKSLAIVNGSTFFLKSKSKKISKQILVNNFKPLFFHIVSAKIGTKIYSPNKLKLNYSVKYKKNKLLLYHFVITHLKLYSQSLKITTFFETM